MGLSTEDLARAGLSVRIAQRLNHLLWQHPVRGGREVSALVSKMLIGRPHSRIICPTRYGFNLIVDPTTSETVDREIYFKGAYESGTIEVMKNCLRPEDVFLDVGSHIGLMTLAAAHFVGAAGIVHAFEPEPTTFEILRANLTLNQVRNTEAHNTALGLVRGDAHIYTNPQLRGSASLSPGRAGAGQTHEVTIDTLDNFVESTCPGDPAIVRMVKIDVEGWELQVLQGGARLLGSRNAPILCVEQSALQGSDGVSATRVYDFLTSVNDFQIYRLAKGKERTSKLMPVKHTGQLPRHDNLFCFTPEHLRTVTTKIFCNL